MSDIRKWFMKKHDKDNGNAVKLGADSSKPAPGKVLAASSAVPEKSGGDESAARRKTSKYFNKDSDKSKPVIEKVEVAAKRKTEKEDQDSDVNIKPPPAKKAHKVMDADEDDEFSPVSAKKKSSDTTPTKKLKGSAGRAVAQKNVEADESDEEMDVDKKSDTPVKSGGRGRGGRTSSAPASGGRGRGGGGRGGFMNFGERKDPPHKGEKEVPEGAPNCLAGLTFVISGTLDSLEREEAEDLIKRHGGRVTGSVSKKTNYLLCDEDIGGRKSEKAKELGTKFLTEDGLFDLIRASQKSKSSAQDKSKKKSDITSASLVKKSDQIVDKGCNIGISTDKSKTSKSSSSPSPAKRKGLKEKDYTLTWTEKYRPKTLNDIVGNQAIAKRLHDWLSSWDKNFLHNEGKGKKQNNAGDKKAVLMSGTPGIGKTTTAKVVSKMLGFEVIEVNASDSRGKADSQIVKGVGGSTANSIKELINNEFLGGSLYRSKRLKAVLIMDEVDGMSAGDRGGVADLISSIKASKIPIICICNDRYSQKLKSLVNYCELLSFRKPLKAQLAKRLLQIANAEGLQVNEIALEELADRCNGDIRMALNHLQYMSLSMTAIQYDDIRKRLTSSAKDEDISPFTAVDKLFDFSGGKLRMDERIDLSMSDLDLVPLIIQENYANYRPNIAGKDDSGMKRMDLLARAAESIADGDIINVQIRRNRLWQLSPSACISSCVVPASLMHGKREALMQGERNYNRFGGWLGKNSTMGKNYRILEDLHVHMLASTDCYMGRGTLRLDYYTLLSKQLTEPLRVLPKDEGVKKVVDTMYAYSMSMEDYETVMELSKFEGRGRPSEGILPAVKSALTKAYKEGSKSHKIRTADLITLPGFKKPPKKRIAAILEPVDEIKEENGDAVDSEDENAEDAEEEDSIDGVPKVKLDLESDLAKGIQVEVELKTPGKSAGKGGRKAPAGRGKGSSGEAASGKRGGRGSGGGGSAVKRKR